MILMNRVPHVYLIDASTKNSIETALVLIATAAKIETSVDAALKWFSSHEEQWFLIFRDFDDRSVDLHAYLPSNNRGRILVTTKHPVNRQLGTSEAHFAASCHYQVSEMEYNEAVQLLLRTAQVQPSVADSEHAGAIVVVSYIYPQSASICANTWIQELGCHAQSVARAGNSIIQAEMTIKAYRDSLSNRFVDLDTSLRQTVNSVYSDGYSQLGEHAKQLLHLCSYLHHTGITTDMFQTASEQVMTFKRSVPLTVQQDSLCQELRAVLSPYQLGFHRWDPAAFAQVLKELRSHSLIRYTPGDLVFSLPPMVPRWIQSLAPPNTQVLAELFLFVSMPSKDLYSTEGTVSRLRYLPHINSVRRHRPVAELLVDAAAFFARVFRESGLWSAAEPLQALVLQMRLEILGQDHPATIHATTECANRLFQQGHRDEATDLMEFALMSLRDVCREDNLEILQVMHDLSDFYLQSNRLKESRDMCDAVLAARREVLGNDHPATVVTEFHASVLDHWDNLIADAPTRVKVASERLATFLGPDDPLTLYAVACAAVLGEDPIGVESSVKQCWSRLKEVAGEEHPITLEVMNIVADAHRLAGHGTEGQTVVDSLYEIIKRTRGEDHFKTFEVLTSIVQFHFFFARIPEAQEHLVRIVDGRKRVLGREDPDTLMSVDSLAAAYMQSSQFVEAERLATGVLQVRKRQPDRWQTGLAMSLSLCSQLYQAQENWIETERTQTELIKLLERSSVDASQLDVLVAQATLVWAISRQGRFTEAEKLHTELDEKMRRLGQQHSTKVTDAKHYLSMAYRARLRYSDAVNLQAAVIQHRATILGERHPSTLDSCIFACYAFADIGKVAEAEDLLKAVFDVLTESVAAENLLLLAAKRARAWIDKVKGMSHKAIESYDEILQVYRRLLGDTHHLVLSVTTELASACYSAGRFDEARSHYVSLLRQKEVTLGRDHAETLAIEHDFALVLEVEGRFKEAWSKRSWIFDTHSRMFGSDHPYTLKSRLWLSHTMSVLGQYSKAQAMQEEIIWMMSQTLGDVHVETLDAKLRLAINYFYQLRYDDAEKLLEGLEQQHGLAFGKTHPISMESQLWLGKVYRENRKRSAAREKLYSVANNRETILGPDEPETWEAINEFAEVLIGEQQFSTAETLVAGTLEKARRRYGAHHAIFWGSQVTQMQIYAMSNRAPQALQLSQSLLDQMVRAHGEDHPWSIAILSVQASIYEVCQGRLDLAKPLQRRVAQLKRQAGMDTPGGATGDVADSLASLDLNNFQIPTNRKELLLQGLLLLMKP